MYIFVGHTQDMLQVFYNFYSKILVQDGDYYRLLTNGDYHITASIDGYLSSTKLITVENKHHSEAKIMNFTLQPVSFYNIINCDLILYNITSTIIFCFQIILPSNYNNKRKRLALANLIVNAN